MRLSHLTGRAAFIAALISVAPSAWAAGAADDAAAAALFDDGKRLMDAGRTEEACTKFVEAQHLSPTPGTMLNIGKCNETAGRLASAWGAYREAEALARTAGDTPRQAKAVEWAQALEPRLSRITIAPPASPIAGLEVRWDGRVVGPGQWGSPIPVDAGEHTLEATAPGRAPSRTIVRVSQTPGNAAVRIPDLAPGDGSQSSTPEPRGSTQRTVGVAIAGVGVAGFIVGSIFGTEMFNKKNQSLTHCLPNNPSACDAQGVSLRNDAYSDASVATAAFIAGGIAVGAGLLTFFIAPSAAPSTTSVGVQRLVLQPSVRLGTGSLTLTGEW